MTCACISIVDAQLRERNLALNYAWTLEPFHAVPQIATRWVNELAAPKGLKKHPPAIVCSFCPFCGSPVSKREVVP